MPDDSRRDKLLKELDSDGNDYFTNGFWNNMSICRSLSAPSWPVSSHPGLRSRILRKSVHG